MVREPYDEGKEDGKLEARVDALDADMVDVKKNQRLVAVTFVGLIASIIGTIITAFILGKV